MKVEVTPAKPDFQPVTLSITIESFAELAVLFARFNCPVAIIKQYGFGIDPISVRVAKAADFSIEDTDESNRIFDHISDIAKGYYNKKLGLDIL
jgi:hypothetical protein